MKEKNKSKMLNKTASNVQDVLFQKPKLSISMNWDATNTARFMMNYWELVRLQVFGVKGSQTYAMWTLPDSSFSLTLYILYFTREEKISWFFVFFFFSQTYSLVQWWWFTMWYQTLMFSTTSGKYWLEN